MGGPSNSSTWAIRPSTHTLFTHVQHTLQIFPSHHTTILSSHRIPDNTLRQSDYRNHSSPPKPRRSMGHSQPAKPIFQWVRGDLIGKGSFGRVYLSLNATTGEIMAVKQVELPKSDRTDSRQMEVIQALKFESDTLKDLDHPNIVQYLGFEENPEFMSIFLEYIPGGSIGSCLKNHGPFDESTTKSFASQILKGLEYLHSRNIIHRDLKADNILVEQTGICKISDFGISKRAEDIEGKAFTGMMGTIYWMAPEVVDSNCGYDSKVDIWSVGCVIVEMWTGFRPWRGHEVIPVMLKLAKDKQAPPLPPDLQLSELGHDLRRKCFAINPRERPTAAQLQHHPYLQLPAGWQFNPRAIEGRTKRRSIHRSRMFKQSRQESLRDIPPVPQDSRIKTTHQAPPVVIITPLRTNPMPNESRYSGSTSESPATSESAKTSSRRKSFYIANPDPDPDDNDLRKRERSYVYNPPPLPPSSSSSLVPHRQSTLHHYRSQPSLSASSCHIVPPLPTQPHDVHSSDSESESDTGTSMWKRPPIDITPSTRPSNRRRSILESKRASVWARPVLEDVYNNLADFFPDHDLDRPVPSADTAVAPLSTSNVKKRRTIRMVAEQAQRILTDDPVQMQKGRTKLWGTQTEEVLTTDVRLDPLLA